MSNKSYDEIIDYVKSQFNGNKAHDRQIIIYSINEYKNHEDGPEIVRQLSKLLYEYLTPDEINKFKEALKKDLPERYLFNVVNEDLNNKRYDEAFKKLDEYMNNENKAYTDDKSYEYHLLESDMEFVLFKKYYMPQKEVRLVTPDVPLIDLYYIYAFLLVEKNDLEKAEKYLKIALRYNPVSSRIISELTDLYKQKRDYDNMYRYIKLNFRYAYTPEFLARAYRDCGFYHIEIKKYDLAVASYVHSLKYDDNPNAYHELEYLKNNGININMTSDEAENILKENNIQVVADTFIVNKYKEFGDKLSANKEFEKALELYRLAYILDDNLENQMKYKMTESIVNGTGEVNITL